MGTDVILFALLVVIFLMAMAIVILSIELRASNRERNRWEERYFKK